MLTVWPPAGINETPDTTFGRWLTEFPSGRSVLLRETVTLIARPVRADASAIVVLGQKGNDVYCLDATAHKVSVPDLMTLIDEADLRWQPDVIAFEANAAFRGIRDLFARHARFGPKLVGVSQTRSKPARFAAFAVRVQSGCFRLMGCATGLCPSQQSLWTEITSYPFGDTNDLLDAAAMGTEIKAANSGRAAIVRDMYFEGGLIVIDHGESIFTLYMHLSEFLIKEGAAIEKGQRIAKSGASGRATGPHLHFAVQWQGSYLEPSTLLHLWT